MKSTVKGVCVELVTAATALAIAGCHGTPSVPLPEMPAEAHLIALSQDQVRATPRIASASCNIETIDHVGFGSGAVPLSSRSIVVSGWLLPQGTHKPTDRSALRFIAESGTAGWQTPIKNWNARPDVLKAFDAADAGDVGFSERLDASALTAGTYRLVVVFEEDGKTNECDKGRRVIVQ